jgi:hypothetical protein
MLAQFFKYLGIIELADSEIEQIVSLDSKGKYVTLGELVEQLAPREVVGRFGRTPKSGRTIKPVHDLDDHESEQIVDAYLDSIPPDQSFAVTGHGSFTADELRREVHQRTELGRRYVAMVKQHNMFLEEAVKRGKIQRKTNGVIKVPPFDF